MQLPDSFYIALIMTVLLVGAVYWVWTQIQFVQRKVNVLENALYELKTICSRPPPDILMPSSAPSQIGGSPYPPAPSSVLGEDEDLLHEQLMQNITNDNDVDVDDDDGIIADNTEAVIAEESPSLEAAIHETEVADFSLNDLQPGGVGSGSVNPNSVLDSMNIKDLRRLADQKGISGTKEMKKKELIAAIRALPTDF